MSGRSRGGNRGHGSHHGGGDPNKPTAEENARNERETQKHLKEGRADPVLDGVEDGEDPPTET